jgi:hypothetical protein
MFYSQLLIQYIKMLFLNSFQPDRHVNKRATKKYKLKSK